MTENVRQAIEALTAQRVALDSLGKNLSSLPRSRGASMAITRLELGRMWVGELKGALGSKYPYDKTKEAVKPSEIQDAVDKADRVPPVKIEEGEQEIVALNQFREAIDNEIIIFRGFKKTYKLSIKDYEYLIAYNNAFTYLKEAKMALGLRLGEIKDNGNK